MFLRENVRAWTACSPQSMATAVIDSALCSRDVMHGALTVSSGQILRQTQIEMHEKSRM